MQTFPGWGPSNPFYQGFESTPEGQRANYFSFEPQFGSTPNMQKYFRGAFQQVQDKYKGLTAAYLKGGGQDPQSASNFYEDYFARGGGAQQDWMNLSPAQRGQQTGRFAPQVQWDLNGPRF